MELQMLTKNLSFMQGASIDKYYNLWFGGIKPVF